MYRMLLASLFIIPFVFKHKYHILKIKRKEWFSIGFAGLFLASHFGLWFESLNHTTVASSTLILALQPGIALLFGVIFFKERTTLATILTLLIAFIGVIIVGGGNLQVGQGAFLGNVLSFLSVICVVIYLMITQRNVQSVNHWVYSFLVFLTAGLIMLIVNIFSNTAIVGYEQKDWIVFILLALFPTAAQLIFNMLLKYVNSTTVSMSVLGEPIGASILAYFILKEKLTVIELIGGFVIVCGIYLFLRVQSRSSVKQVETSERIVS